MVVLEEIQLLLANVKVRLPRMEIGYAPGSPLIYLVKGTTKPI